MRGNLSIIWTFVLQEWWSTWVVFNKTLLLANLEYSEGCWYGIKVLKTQQLNLIPTTSWDVYWMNFIVFRKMFHLVQKPQDTFSLFWKWFDWEFFFLCVCVEFALIFSLRNVFQTNKSSIRWLDYCNEFTSLIRFTFKFLSKFTMNGNLIQCSYKVTTFFMVWFCRYASSIPTLVYCGEIIQCKCFLICWERLKIVHNDILCSMTTVNKIFPVIIDFKKV